MSRSAADRATWLLRPQRDAELAQLALLDRRRGSGQQVEAGGRLREGDHVADGLRAVEPLHDPVEAVGDAAVRRGSVAERLEQEAEALLRLGGADPERLEHLRLGVGVADPDRAAAQLLPVPDD